MTLRLHKKKKVAIPLFFKYYKLFNSISRFHFQDLDIYIKHQAHIAFKAQFITPIVSDILAFDYEAL